MKRFLLGVFAVLLLAATVFVVPTVWFQPWSVDHLYGRVFITYAMRHPELLTQLGILNRVPFGSWRDRLDDYSPAMEEKDFQLAQDNLSRLHRYDRRKMSESARLSYDVMDWFLTDAVKSGKFRDYDYPLNQMFGFQSGLPDFMLTLQPLKTPRDAESYLRRVAAFGPAFEQTAQRVELREKKGILPPRFVLREVREQMEKFIAKPPDQNDLYTHFVTGTDSIRGLDPAKRDQLRKQLAQEIAEVVVPSYQKMIVLVKGQEQRATDDDGVWKLPDGDAFYDAALRRFTTSDLPADTIHALGLREVGRLQTEMRPLMDRVKLTKGTFAARLLDMNKSPRFGFPAGDSGRAQILARYQEILDDASKRCDSLFDVRPKARLEVKRVPPFKEATTPGAYYNEGALDGSRPGVFFANLRNPAETRRPDMRTLAYHEGIPGHHFQISVAQEMKDVPFFRKVIPFTAYVEGWALYSEHLALEKGFHQDAYDSLGAMRAELFRAVRLVVDTGIHRDRWTRQQAIDYMLANTGMDTAEVVTEIERYIVLPGQACAYKVGQLEILQLRDRAMNRLGDRFDIKKFHDVVLTHGALPLALLDRVVDQWIDSELSAAGAAKKG
jgi:uncharacterized protein (DUF885 family)